MVLWSLSSPVLPGSNPTQWKRNVPASCLLAHWSHSVPRLRQRVCRSGAHCFYWMRLYEELEFNSMNLVSTLCVVIIGEAWRPTSCRQSRLTASLILVSPRSRTWTPMPLNLQRYFVRHIPRKPSDSPINRPFHFAFPLIDSFLTSSPLSVLKIFLEVLQCERLLGNCINKKRKCHLIYAIWNLPKKQWGLHPQIRINIFERLAQKWNF